jgi:hypothetical protein
MRHISLLFGLSCILTLGCGSSASGGGGVPDAGGMGGSGGSGGSTGGSGGTAGSDAGSGDACVPTGEACDGTDNDCDGVVDEDCECKKGDSEACYSGPIGTEDVGTCTGGTRVCTPEGVFGPCVGEILPNNEVCDGADNDCNGSTDELGQQTCGVGACEVTVEVCTNGAPVFCTPLAPSAELCDLIDNDCNGSVDDNFATAGDPCNTGYLGPCGVGEQACTSGIVVCNQVTTPSPETCDGVDNDCDGTSDDNDPGGGGSCSTGQQGPCGAGILQCTGGSLACQPLVTPSTETCDGVDNDCDGTPDDGNPGGGQSCGCGGTVTCSNGALGCVGGPATYLIEDFSDNSAGWTLGSTWQIGPTVMSPPNPSCGIGDPAQDHTATSDNGVAGAVIGGNVSQSVSGPFYLTSPVVNTAAATTLVLEYWRWLHSDYPNFMIDTVEVYNGTSWISLWQNPAGTVINDTTWVKMSHDLTPYKNANMQIRFSYQIGSSGVYLCAGWNVDDILIAASACP